MANCAFDTCPRSQGESSVRSFAQSNSAFVGCFERAWEKMVTAGSDDHNLQEPLDIDNCEDLSPRCRANPPRNFCAHAIYRKKCPKTCNVC